jgi:hypothetical protein
MSRPQQRASKGHRQHPDSDAASGHDLHHALRYLEAVHELLNFAPPDLVPRRLALPARWPQTVVSPAVEPPKEVGQDEPSDM